jgi:hypothetical protein
MHKQFEKKIKNTFRQFFLKQLQDTVKTNLLMQRILCCCYKDVLDFAAIELFLSSNALNRRYQIRLGRKITKHQFNLIERKMILSETSC